MNVLRWTLRIGTAWLLFGLIYPVTHRAPLQTPQTVQTLHPHVCVHTDLKDEVDEWKIQRSLQLVREMGTPTIVEFFPWPYFQPVEGQFNWYQADRIMRHAENQGVRVIARLGLVPDWARPDGSQLNTLPDDSFDDFARFAAAFVERYREQLTHIIVWNEPNLAFEWGFGDFSPERYVRLLQTTYPAIKSIKPEITVLGGALAPTLEPEGSPNGLNDLLYLTQMYESGAAPYFDALAVHTYGFRSPPLAEPAPDALNFRRVELLREIMQEYGDESKPIYITESGWNDSPRWNRAVTPSERIAYTLDALNWTAQQDTWLRTMCIWIFRYPRPTYRYPDYFTIITPEFQTKPIYHAIQSYTRDENPRENDLWLPPPGE